MIVSELLKKYMLLRKINLMQLSTLSGVNVSVLSDYVSGFTIPCKATFMLLSSVLNMNSEDYKTCIKFIDN